VNITLDTGDEDLGWQAGNLNPPPSQLYASFNRLDMDRISHLLLNQHQINFAQVRSIFKSGSKLIMQFDAMSNLIFIWQKSNLIHNIE